MNPELQGKSKEAKHPFSIIMIYICAVIVTIVAIADLVTNIILYRNNITQYVAQGYPRAEVAKQLIPTQLLPGIYEAIGYLGIACILYTLGMLAQRHLKYFKKIEPEKAEPVEAVPPVDEIKQDTPEIKEPEVEAP